MGPRTLVGEKMKRTYTDFYGNTFSLNHPCLFSTEGLYPEVYQESLSCFEWGNSIKYVRARRRSPLHSMLGYPYKDITHHQWQYRLLSDEYNVRVFRGDLYDVWR